MADASTYAVNRANGTAFNPPAAATPTATGGAPVPTAGNFIPRNPITGAADYSQAIGPQFGQGTMNAVITAPNPNAPKVPAPVVITADAAQKNLANIKAQVDQLAQDVTAHKAAMATPQGTPVTDTKTSTTDSTKTEQPSQQNQPLSLNDQINEAINGLSEGNKTIDASSATALDPLAVKQKEIQDAKDSAAVTALGQLDSIAHGTYPLSASESALLDSTRATYMSTIQGQTVANDAFVGQMTELAASLGISTSAPSQAIGMIHGAISAGNEKVANLNGQMAQALATLQQGFQKDDFQMVHDAWIDTAKYYDDRLDAIKDMQQAVIDGAKQQKTDLMDMTKTTLQYMVASAQFTHQEKQDAIQNAFTSRQINETERHNLATESLTRETNGSGGGTFSTTQINAGAANAGVPVDVFRGWSADAKNVFINGKVDGTKKTIDDALATGSVEDVQAAIKDMKLPAEAEQYFLDYAAGNDPGGTSLDKRTSAFADTFTDLMNQGYDRNEALDEVNNEWSDGGKSPVTKVDDRMIHDALEQVYGSVWAPGGEYNDGTGFTRFGK